jgi:hypothetical protein
MNNFMVFSQVLSNSLSGIRPTTAPTDAFTCGVSVQQDADMPGNDILVNGKLGMPNVTSSESCW